jgi:hypothetical protein
MIHAVSIATCAVLLMGAPAGAEAESAAGVESKDLTLKGDQSGTVFRSLTVEGENRIRIEIARPKLHLDLDPRSAPGLDPGSIRRTVDHGRPSLLVPFHAQVASQASPYTARPWLDGFATGPVARFHPDVDDVDRWRLVVADSRGREVAAFDGRGRPRGEIVWDGRAADGSMALPGLTYTYVFQAQDRAGNRRNFMGDGFSVPAYRRSSDAGVWFVFSGRSAGLVGMQSRPRGSRPVAPPMLVEIASRIHQSAAMGTVVRIRVIARRYEEGEALAQNVASSLSQLLMADPARIVQTVNVESDAPAGGTVIVSTES